MKGEDGRGKGSHPAVRCGSVCSDVIWACPRLRRGLQLAFVASTPSTNRFSSPRRSHFVMRACSALRVTLFFPEPSTTVNSARFHARFSARNGIIYKRYEIALCLFVKYFYNNYNMLSAEFANTDIADRNNSSEY